MTSRPAHATDQDTDQEIERERRRWLARRRKVLAKDNVRIEDFAPGTRGCHEALHLSSVLLDTFDRHLLDHSAVIADPEWFRLAWRAHEYLFALYQQMGAGHLRPAASRENSGTGKAGPAGRSDRP